ncbi:MAG: chemotaxis protein CheA [Candidatus Omnitrophota bacterium]
MGLEQYKNLFITESEEHLQLLNNAILELEKKPDNLKILNEIFRSAHTLKGMSATMGFEALTKLTHKMEDVLDIFRTQKKIVTVKIIDILFKCLDMLEVLLEEVKTEKNLNVNVEQMVEALEEIISSDWQTENAQLTEKNTIIDLTELEKKNINKLVIEHKFKVYTIDIYLTDDCQLKSVRVFMVFNILDKMGEVIKSAPTIEALESNNFDKMFSLLFLTFETDKKIESVLKNIIDVERIVISQTENIDAADNDQSQMQEEKLKQKQAISKTAIQSAGFKKIQSIRVSTQRLDKLMNFVGELVISKIRLMQIGQAQEIPELHEVLTQIDRLTSDLQDEVMQARLIPMSQVFDRFPRMVRDLARERNKQIDLEISGGEIELDRTVLDEIADPLVHLLRNSIDHGIETPSERKSLGKNPIGVISLTACRQRTYALIKVSDDGRGIDPKILRKIALEKKFFTKEEISKLSDHEVLNFITLPGFSSAAKVTDISGRGVGMDVVKMKVESLGGMLSFESEVGKRSSFKLLLPLTVAIIRAMLVKVGKEIYAIPISNIAETVKVSTQKIKFIEKLEVINLRNEVLPLVRLRHILGTQDSEEAGKDQNKDKGVSIVVVERSAKKIGLVIDTVIGQQEVVIKSIGKLLKSIKGFAGATILGDGKVALILDVGTLVG